MEDYVTMSFSARVHLTKRIRVVQKYRNKECEQRIYRKTTNQLQYVAKMGG